VVTLLAIIEGLAAESRPGFELRATLDSSLERDLGLDSLARVELISRIEDGFGVQLPEAALSRSETPRDLLNALRSAGATTLGLADVNWDQLQPELRDALADYYRVDDLGDYDQLTRALGWFITTITVT